MGIGHFLLMEVRIGVFVGVNCGVLMGLVDLKSECCKCMRGDPIWVWWEILFIDLFSFGSPSYVVGFSFKMFI